VIGSLPLEPEVPWADQAMAGAVERALATDTSHPVVRPMDQTTPGRDSEASPPALERRLVCVADQSPLAGLRA
jgi:hypothetical protein